MNPTLLISEKITSLEDAMKSSQMERDKLLEKVGNIDVCVNILDDINVSIKDYDFSKIIEILGENNIQINNLEQTIIDVKNIAEFNELKGITNFDLYDEYKSVLNELKSKLLIIKSQLETKLNSIVVVDYTDDINNLNNILSFINGNIEKLELTKEMLKSLHTHILSKNSLDTLLPLYNELYKHDLSKKEDNNEKLEEEKKEEDIQVNDISQIVELFKNYFEVDDLTLKYINNNREDILDIVNYNNTKKILDFINENKFLGAFSNDKIALVRLSIAGEYKNIQNVYNGIIEEVHDKNNLKYFCSDEMASIWIKKIDEDEENSDLRKRGNIINYAPLSWNQVKRNIQILKGNSDILNCENDTDYYNNFLIRIVKPETLEKNIKIYRGFGLYKDAKVDLTILYKIDLERRINIAIELGLLKSPMTYEYRKMESDIPKSYEFEFPSNINVNRESNIRNYFINFMSKIVIMSDLEFSYLAYKLAEKGQQEFYSDFFSPYHPGRMRMFTSEERMKIKYHEDYDFINPQDEIANYDEYEETINGSNILDEPNYYDHSLFYDEIILALETNNTLMENYDKLSNEQTVKNEFIYKFGSKLISRKKVLHNLTILKQKYGEITDDVLLFAITRDSYITRSEFDLIKEQIHERSR